ncbi:MAG: fibronectin type III domain-containing protein [Bacteriovoracaceae bacterium]
MIRLWKNLFELKNLFKISRYAHTFFYLSALVFLTACNPQKEVLQNPNLDKAGPSVSVEQAITEVIGNCTFTAATDPTKVMPLNYKVSFSEIINPSTFTTDDIMDSGSSGASMNWALTSCGDFKTFKLTVSAVTMNGVIAPIVKLGSVSDPKGNLNEASSSVDNQIKYDTVRPTLTINQAIAETVGSCAFTAATDPSNTTGFSYRVQFSEAINTSTFTTSDITNNGTGGSTTLTWSLTDCGDHTNFKLTAAAVVGDGTIIPKILASKVTDLAGNNNFASTATDNSITFDSNTPGLTINQAISETVGTCTFSAQSDPTSSSAISYRVTFTKVMNPATFTTSDIINNGTGGSGALTWSITNCGDDKNFKLSTTAITGNGTIIPSVAANSVQDSSSNNNTVSTSTDNTVTFDSAAPTVVINQSSLETVGSCNFLGSNDPTNSTSLSYKVTFSEAIDTATFTTADITNSGTGGGVTLSWLLTDCGDHTNFKLSTTALVGDGTIVPTISASALTDLAGNLNTASTSTDNSITFDSTSPSVTINQATTETVGTCSFTAVTDPSNTAGFAYKVVFSEAISAASFTTADITNNGTGGATALTWSLSDCGDHTNFKLVASAITGDGTIVPSIAASAIQDPAGNNNSVSTSTDNSVTYDNAGPSLAINQATTETVGSCSFVAPSDPTNAASIQYKVVFSEAINAATFTTADITNNGTGGGTALTWAITDCGDHINFKLAASSITGDGTIIPSVAANTVKDNSGNDNSASTATDNSVTYDTTSPSVTVNQATTETVGSCSFTAVTDPTNTAGFAYKVVFSEAINAATFTTADITNNGTGGGTTLTWALTDCGDHTNFKLVASAITGDGTIVPSLAASTVQDSAGNNNSISTTTDNSVTYETSGPSLTINQATTETVGSCSFTAVTDPTNTAGFAYKVTFSKAINAATFTNADITNNGAGGATALTWALTDCGDHTNFKLVASAITGNGTIIPSVAANAVQDSAGNNNSASTSTDNSVTYDTTGPSVTINQATTETVGSCLFVAPNDPSNSAGFTYKVTFSEAIDVATFTVADVNNSGTGGGTTLTWALSDCGDHTNFQLTASVVTGDGTIIPNLSVSAVKDVAGNNSSVSTATDNSVTYDTSAPSVTINQATTETVGSCSFTAPNDPTNTVGFAYKVVFSEAINAATFTTADISNSGTGGATALTWTLSDCGDHTNFKLVASAITGNGTIIPTLALNKVQDSAGNNNTASTATDNSVTYDTAGPSVTINQATTETVGTCSFTAPNDPTNATGFAFKVVFSEAVDAATFTTADITNNGTGGASVLTWSLSDCGDHTNFKLVASAITGDGTIIPSISASTVKDTSGNDNSASTATDNSVTYDTAGPSVTVNQATTQTVGSCSFTAPSDPTNAASIQYKVVYSEAIDAATFTSADITNNGTGGATALTWTITDCGDHTNFKLVASSITGDGTIIPSIAASAVQDVAGNNSSASTATDNSVTYDTAGPSVTVNQATTETVGSCSFTAPSDPTNAASIQYKVIYSEAISAATFTTADITNNGTGGATALTWTITDCGDHTNFKLVASSITGDGTIVPSIAASAVQDPSGNNNSASTATDNSVTYDATGPSVTINEETSETVGSCSFSNTTDPTNSAGFSYKVAFSEAIDTATFTTADITNNGTGGSTALTWSLTNCGDDKNFKLTATAITGYGTIVPSIGASSVQDPVGNNNSASTATDNSITYAILGLSVTINQATTETVGTCSFTAASDPSSSVGFSYRVTFTNAISTGTFTTADITNNGTGGATTLTWSLSNCGDDKNFKLTATAITGDGTIVPSIAAAAVQDTLANDNTASTSTDNSVTYDSTAPSVTVNQATTETVGTCSFTAPTDPTKAATIHYKVVFSEAISAATFTNADITNNGTGGATALTWALSDCGDHINFKLVASSITGDGTLIPSIAASAVQDPAGNNNSLSTATDNSVTYDTTGPTVTINQSITETVGTCSFVVTTDPAGYVPISYRVTFDEAINTSSFATSDITNSGTGGATTLVWSLTNCGDDKNFNLTATSITGYGTIIPSIAANAVQDPLGNDGSASTATDNSVTYSNIGWAQEAYIKAGNNNASDFFGWSLSLNGDTLAVGAYAEDSNQVTITNGTGSSTDNTATNAGAVYVYKRAGTNWAQEAYIKAGNANANDYFGYSVSLSGDSLAVGAYAEDSNLTVITNGTGTSTDNTGTDSGAVYVFKRTGSNWAQEAYVKAANNAASDNLGRNVSLSGDILAVGADGEDSNQTTITNGTTASSDNSVLTSGAIYIYKRTGVNWAQEAYVKASNVGASDAMGYYISLSGDTLAVGVPLEDSNQTSITNGNTASSDNSASDSGAVYVYRRNGTSWIQEAYIKSSNSEANDQFGINVSISGDTIAVGAYLEDSNQTSITNGATSSSNNSASASGAVYVYRRNGYTWTQEAYIKSSNAEANDQFGQFVSLDGNTLVALSQREDSNLTTVTNGTTSSADNSSGDSGAAYVYKRNGTTWSQEAYIKASNNGSDYYGSAVSISGDTIAVGVYQEDSNQTTITNGATSTTDNSNSNSGAVYVYRSNGRLYDPADLAVTASSTTSLTLSWQSGGSGVTGYKLAYTTGVNPPSSCSSGTVVDVGNVLTYNLTGLSGNTNYAFRVCSYNASALSDGITATFQTSSAVPDPATLTATVNSSAAITLNWTSGGGGTTGFKIAYAAGSPPADCATGTVIDAGNVLTYQVTSLHAAITYGFRVCAYDGSSNISYGRYVSALTNNTPEPTNLVVTSNSSGTTATISWTSGGANTNGFKVAYATATSTAPATCSAGTNVDAGNVSSYTVTGLTAGTQIAFRICSYDQAGIDISSGATTNGTSTSSGWNQEAYIKASNAEAGDYFGMAVGIHGDTLVVGAYLEDSNQTTITNGSSSSSNNSATSSGAAYVYKRTGTTWVQEAYLKAANAEAYDSFGIAVSINGDTIAVSASAEDSSQVTITNGSTASSDNALINSGAVYIYKRTGSNWAQEAYIKAANAGSSDSFGATMALSGDTLAVGANLEDSSQNYITNGTTAAADNGLTDSGAVYIYKRTGTTWAQEAYIKAVNPDSTDAFGQSGLSISGDTLAVSAYQEDSNQTTITNGASGSSNNSAASAGAVYVYQRTGSFWIQQAYIKAANAETNDSFGMSQALSGDTLAVGAHGEDSNLTTITNGTGTSADNTVASSGAVYIYKRTGPTWAQEAYIKASNAGNSDQLGRGMSMSGNTVVVGAIGEDSNQTTITNGSTASADNSTSNAGAVYVYKRTGTTWAQEAYIKPPYSNSGLTFGYSTAISGDTITVGTYMEDSASTTIINGNNASTDTSAADSGAVWVFRNNARLFDATDVYPSASTTSSITLSWGTGGTLATGYKIAYQAGSTPPADCNSGTMVDAGNVSSYSITGLTSASYYSFRICTYDSSNNLSEGFTATYTTATAVPEPASLTLGSATSSTILVSWTSGGGSTTGFKIAYQSGYTPPADCNSGTVIDAGNTTSYTLTSLNAQVMYGIRLCAYDGSGNLSFGRSGFKTTTSTPDVTSVVISSNAAGTEATVSWVSGGANTNGFRVAYATGTTTAPATCNSGTNLDAGNVTSCAITGLAAGTMVAARVCSYNQSGIDVSTGTTNFGPTNSAGWNQEAYIKSSNIDAGDYFGYSVSLSSDTLAVGAFQEDSNQTTITNGTGSSSDNTIINSGAVYVYKRTGTTWAQEAYIKAINAEMSDSFGWNVAISGNTLAVGAIGEDSSQTTITNGTTASSDNSYSASGSVYIYTRSGSTWSQQAYAKSANANGSDNFGYSLSLNGESLAVGAYVEDSAQTTITNGSTAAADNTKSDSGAVYVYKRSGTTWSPEAYVKATNPDASDYYGFVVSLHGDTLSVGAYQEDSNQTTITNGNTASSDNSASSSGAVYVYRRSSNFWIQEAYIKAGNAELNDNFGIGVSLNGDTIAVGASGEDSNLTTITNGTGTSADNTSSASGAVYVYKRTSSSWAQEAYLKASNNGGSDQFGRTVSLSGNTLAVGAIGDDSNQVTITNGTTSSTDNSTSNSGSVFIYKRTGSSWAQEAYIKAINAGADNYSFSLSLNGDTLAVGSYQEDSSQSTITNGTSASYNESYTDSGAVYVYRNNNRLFDPTEFYVSSSTNNTITLTWSNAGSMAAGYKIAYNLGSTPPADCNSGTVVDVGNVLTYSVIGLSSNSNYSFRICSYDSLSNLSEGYTTTYQTATAVPEPTNLSATVNSSSAITLNWSSGGGSTTGFKLAYQASDVPPANCASGTVVDLGNVVTYQVTSLHAGISYAFRVCSYDGSANTSYGNYAVATTQTTPEPSNLVLSSNSAGTTVTVSWTSGGGNTNGFKVAYATGTSTAPATCNAGTNVDAGNVSSYNITGLSAGTLIAVRVCSYDQTGIDISAGITAASSSNASGWNQEAYIKASNSDSLDNFGNAVAISGETIAVGAYYEDSGQTTITNGTTSASDNTKTNSGAVFVYKRSGVTWSQEAYLKTPNPDLNDIFGYSVSISGDTIVAGSYAEDSTLTTITNGTTASADNTKSDAGAVYVFKRTGSSWAQEAFIKASNSDSGDQFGYSCAISGDTIVVGANGEDSNQTTITNGTTASSNNSNLASGAAYVYKRTGSNWAQEAYLKSPNPDAYDYYGATVAIHGDTIVVGAYAEDSNLTTITNGTTSSTDNTLADSGAVYVYKRTGSSWAQEAFIKAANAGASDNFGIVVSANGDRIVVRASAEDSGQTTITNGTTASSDNSKADSGAVFVYKRSGTSWAQEAYIKPPNPDTTDLFGSGLAISGDTIAVGTRREDSNQTTITNGTTASADNSKTDSGSVHVYKRTGTSWAQEAYIKANNPDASDYFGHWVGLSGDTIVVGAPGEDSVQTTITNGVVASADNTGSDNGAVYVYRNNARLFDVDDVWTTSTSSSVTLTWNQSGGTAATYLVAYQSGTTAPANCASGTVEDAGLVSTHTVTGLSTATTYSFRVCAAVNGSTYSTGTTVTVTTP